VIIGQKIYFTLPLEKKEDMEFLKAMLAEINANMKTNQERLEAKIDANRKTDQEKTDADLEHMQEMIRINQERMEANAVCFSSRQTGSPAKRDASRPRSKS
jgi:N-acyl-D-aspartate/D-glutamate deacylase